ncbi:hypothetical protein ACROYT_G010047 [Oculina patagonica]
MSDGRQAHEECVTEDEETVGETSLHAIVEETPGNDDQESEHEQTGDEEQPLIIVVNDPRANRTNRSTTEHTGCLAVRRIITFLKKIFGKIAVGCGYVILIIAALPAIHGLAPPYISELISVRDASGGYNLRSNNGILLNFPALYVSLRFGDFGVYYDNQAHDDGNQIELTFSNPEVYCRYLNDMSGSSILPLKTPSLESLIRASSTLEKPELRLRGLAVFSNLSDACQPPVHVSKSNIQVNKIALITIANEAECPLQDLAVNAQGAGYSVVIYLITDSADPLLPTQGPSSYNGTQNDSQDKLLIPVLQLDDKCFEVYPNGSTTYFDPRADDHILIDADRRNVEISVSQNTDDLKGMQKYLERLYYWFLLGPVITLEWLRRTRKFCCMSGGRQVHEECVTEDEETVGETGLHAVVEETPGNDDQESEHEETGDEEQPLIIVVNDPHANRTTTGHTGCQAIRRIITFLAKMFSKIAVCCGYVILIVAALPV